MNTDHDRLGEWDGAYVVGALSPSDRHEFEAHLAQCELCRASVSELAPVTGLLSRVDSAHALSLLADPADPAAPDAAPAAVLRQAFVDRARTVARRRRRIRWGAVALAAAIAVIAAIAVPLAIGSTHREVETVAFENLVDAPLTASVELDPVEWGTKIDGGCAYGKGDESATPPDGWPYILVVTGVDGTQSEVSSWRSWPDSQAWVTAGTALERDEIRSMEIRSLTTGTVLMRAVVDER